MTAARRALRGAAGMTDRSCSLQRMVRRSVELMCVHQESKVTRRNGKATLKQTQTLRHHASLKKLDEALLVEMCEKHLPGCSLVRIVLIAGDKYAKIPT